MIKKVERYIRDNKLLENGDKVLVAVSGGPDSICLLHMLNCIKDKFGIKISVAHINHLLREDEAFRDEEYVESTCEKMGIKCYIKRIDIKLLAQKRGISIEMAGREGRYEFFDEIMKDKKYTKVAVAHNANDQAETILMRIMRGTGIEGLTGIKPIRDGFLIRPILSLSRGEIEEYCSKENLNPRIDLSNMERDYSRNRVRLDIIPYMKEYFNSDVIGTINRVASSLSIDNDFIEEQVTEVYDKVCESYLNKIHIKSEILEYHLAIQTRVVKKALMELSKTYRNFEMKHIINVIDLAKKKINTKNDLPNGVFVLIEYGEIYLKLKDKGEGIKKEVRSLVIEKGEILNSEYNYSNYFIQFKIIDNKNNIEFSNNDLIKYFDYDKIEESILIRSRKNGDKIKPLGLKGSKKLKDIFIDLKVPKEERDDIPLVCSGNDILWIVGHKVSEDFKVEKRTKRILEITFVRKEY